VIKYLTLVLGLLASPFTYSQSLQDISRQVNLDSLIQSVRQLSGEDTTTLNDSTYHIQHRVSKRGNDLAAHYLKTKLESYGIQSEYQDYRNRGRNVIGTIIGKNNPDSIYIIGAHYDAVADYCADDNASGSSCVLEAARILSQYCLGNTVKFAFWDEEELGLVGSKHYADTAFKYEQKILGVINIDMMGYDSDSNWVFDIHTNADSANLRLKDTMLYVLQATNSKLVAQVINPGTNRSDHASFWRKGYSAVFFGESFLGGDPNPAYHSSKDRINLFNLAYFHELAKLGISTITELAGFAPPEITVDTLVECEEFYFGDSLLTTSGFYSDSLFNREGCDSISNIYLSIININDSISRSGRILSAIDTGVRYNWRDCNHNFNAFVRDTSQHFEVRRDGNYAVEIIKGICRDTSDCIEVIITGIPESSSPLVHIYPNPSGGQFHIDFAIDLYNYRLNIYDLRGRNIEFETVATPEGLTLNLSSPSGIYTLLLETEEGIFTRKIVLQSE